ncbi:uncharacterized protein LOC132035403 [Lycium ferocissimum]|uniref:uncharacterized protein LOC132035403 n=1 Tax=Lycium ferocissimum TaxID=112874 RepID=UPI0028155D67|nr:uncharacterized protein LOC132035403 [Lycium ferocissimum]
MASASAYLAEAYVMKKQFKEKMMKMDAEGAEIKKQHNPKNTSSSSSSSSGGCFSMKIFKKVHPNTNPHPSTDSVVSHRDHET